MDKLTDLLFASALGLVVLAPVVDRISAVHVVLGYLFLAVIAFNQYDFRVHDGISPLFSLQVGLTFALGTVLIVLVVGGLGFRVLELVAVFVLLLAFVLARDDLRGYLPTAGPYVAAFAVLFGIFLSHAAAYPAGSGLGLFPVFAGVVLSFNCFVLPRYVSVDAVYWSTAAIGTAVVVLALPTLVVGDYGFWLFEVRTWGGSTTIPVLEREVPIVRSIFANPNTLGLLLFPGTVAAYVATHRTLRSRPLLTILPASALPVLAFGLFLSNSRASMLATAVAIGVYTLSATDRRLLPVALIAIAVAVPAFLVAIYYSVIPIDPAQRFTLWRAGIEATYHDSGLFGQGIVGTREAIAPYLDGGGSVHNSYLSIFIRAGILGGLAYCLVVLGPLVQGIVRYDRVDVGMLSLAVGFAVHQLFEAYTVYQFGPGAVLGALAVGYTVASIAGDPATASSGADSATAPGADSPVSTDSFGYGTEVQYRAERPDERP
ncbi:O-antigen ligase [Halalkalicoccus sp. NIPERK01]|uniref:O-antigen ligase family protein n=1 Tax=Halalkalicoccus sp. NIPERK01 TaxID=3053469 RepID=UPI00256ECFF1|nr:O-antigen ligase family protein [Halalkalicoccus sp. NIPERK01]MDL5363487.1 O-antigen ligase family protein [Halalkalicoccus sp. NIPERK01]